MPPRRVRLALVLAFAITAACGGDGASGPTTTVVPRPTLPAPPPQLEEDTGGPAPLALGPRYEEATLVLLPDAEPFGVRDVVEGIDASAAFTVHRFVSAGSPFPVVVGVCSPRAPDGVVLQAQHNSGAVTTLFVWAYEDPGAIRDDWATVDGALRPRPPRPLSAFADPTPAPTPPPTQPAEANATPLPLDENCLTTANVTIGMLLALQHENLVILLTETSPHPGAVHTSPGANQELIALLRNLDPAP